MQTSQPATTTIPTMRLELVQFAATDGVDLAGLLFQPRTSSTTAVVFLHGNGGSSVFSSARTSALAETLVQKGITFFPFDNRGAHYVRRGNAAGELGMSFERIRDSVHDIDGALRFLRSRGIRRFILAGHSSGANKICVYDWLRRPTAPRGYILLAGGDDTGLLRASLGARRFNALLLKAREAIRRGQGREFAPRSSAPFLISWQSLYDLMNPEGLYNIFPFAEALTGKRISKKPLFREIRRIRKPVLMIYGSDDETCFGDVPGCVEAMRDATGGRRTMNFEIIPGTGHGFRGEHRRLGRMMARWIEGIG